MSRCRSVYNKSAKYKQLYNRFQFTWFSRTDWTELTESLPAPRLESLRDIHGGEEERPVRLSPRTVSSQHKSLSLRPCNGWPGLTFSLVSQTCRYKGQTAQITWICRKRRLKLLKVELEGKAGGGGARIWKSIFRPNKYFPAFQSMALYCKIPSRFFL